MKNLGLYTVCLEMIPGVNMVCHLQQPTGMHKHMYHRQTDRCTQTCLCTCMYTLTTHTARTHTTHTHTDTLMYLYKRSILFTCALQVCVVYKYCAHYTHNSAQNLLVISLVCRYSSEVMGEQAVSPPRWEVVIVVDYYPLCTVMFLPWDICCDVFQCHVAICYVLFDQYHIARDGTPIFPVLWSLSSNSKNRDFYFKKCICLWPYSMLTLKFLISKYWLWY